MMLECLKLHTFPKLTTFIVVVSQKHKWLDCEFQKNCQYINCFASSTYTQASAGFSFLPVLLPSSGLNIILRSLFPLDSRRSVQCSMAIFLDVSLSPETSSINSENRFETKLKKGIYQAFFSLSIYYCTELSFWSPFFSPLKNSSDKVKNREALITLILGYKKQDT